MLVGANEGLMLRTNLVETKANMALAKLAGFRAVNLHAFWWPDVTEPREYDQQTLGNVAGASRLLGIPVFVAVTNTRGRYTPQDDDQREQFAKFAANVADDFPSFTKIIVGNEPNLSNFWQPQFDENGGDLAAVNYEKTLATTYDALKAVSPKITVIGGAVSPRGHDDPNAASKSHSPTIFIRDLGEAYKQSGRAGPIMDWFAFHPYGANSSELPTTRHSTSTSITIADYDKLVKALGQAFDGTNQIGSKIPVIYDEYGIESTIPKSKAKKYTGAEPASTKPVSPAGSGRALQAGAQPRFLPADGEGDVPLPRLRRGRPRAVAVGPLLRRPHGEAEPVNRPAGVPGSARGVIARCPGMRLEGECEGRLPGAASGLRGGKARLGHPVQPQLQSRLPVHVQRDRSVQRQEHPGRARSRRPEGRRRT